MQKTLSKVAKSEVLEALRERYREAVKQEKTKILDEFVAVAGCHRKHGIRLLTAAPGRILFLPHAVSTCALGTFLAMTFGNDERPV